MHRTYAQIELIANGASENAMIAASKWFSPRRLRASLSLRAGNLRKRWSQLCASD